MNAFRIFALSLILLLGSYAAGEPFQNLGIGGGGAMYVPVCSPHDHKLMFVACDMGGVYRSTDGGLNWRMLDKRELRNANACPMAFDSKKAERIYAASGATVKVTDDRGEHWRVLDGKAPWEKSAGVTALSEDPLHAGTLFVGTKDGAWFGNAESGWTSCGIKGAIVGFAFAERAKAPAAFIGAAGGIYRSDDGGKSWQDANEGLPFRDVRGFCGSSDTASGSCTLYCTLPGKDEGGRYTGGVYVSRDDGKSWQSAMGEGINVSLGKQDQYGVDSVAQYQFIATVRGLPGTVYVTTRGTGYHPPYHWTVFRSDDFGAHWKYCYTGDPRERERNVEVGWLTLDTNWGFGGPADGFGVCRNDANIAMFTNNGELYITRDGAKTWQCAYSHHVGSEPWKAGDTWKSCGLEVTSCWHYDFDPHDPKRAYICFTDIGFVRSEDGGESWRYGVKGSPWRNSFYQIAFDPERPGVIYAACANQHDIPTWTNVDRPKAAGGVCLSEDYGVSWKPVSSGLPAAPVTSIAVDLRSPAASRVLYVTSFGHGVFKSSDGGTSWKEASNGLGTAENKHVYSVKFGPDGALYCSVTAKRQDRSFLDGSGLYRSSDGGGNWTLISPNLHWAGDFDFDPRDAKVIYLTAASGPGHTEGGLYKTIDGGTHWKRIIKDADLPQELSSYAHAFFVSVDPRRPDRVFFSAHTHGLFVSDNVGGTWREVKDIPFTAVSRVSFDPRDKEMIYVTTFGGGIWKGVVK